MLRRKKTTVQQKSEELIDYTFDMTDSVKRYTKKYKFSFVNRMQNRVLDINDMICEANELPINERRPIQRIVLAKIESLIGLIEISYNRGFIDGEQCSRWGNKALDVKRLTAAWMHRTK